ncbi:glycosyltransferase family 2 protein [Neolewinella antarctica]|uniref:Glycosyltransferase involved in cell wall biosynthesis n=1 Tax=Neolewinella antarctica TaxID=442734 RepID=A0ABX0X5W3_9BACT|nr:glycosyltransferase family A protein [Neolewinella antarctica]NJC24596.1 glycosyltransferase involved in cell wall biosynthesis [Neolewinella antarctica]
MLKPFVSIILPTFNRSTMLVHAVRSVLAQTYREWELIIVDDGSTDDTAAVVAGFDDNRIRYFYQENGELSRARNRGLREVRGEYFGFLDDDDLFLPEHLSVMVAVINKDAKQHAAYRSGLILRLPGKEVKALLWDNSKSSLLQHWELHTGIFGILFQSELVVQRPFNPEQLLLEDFTWFSALLTEFSLLQHGHYTAVVQQHANQRSGNYLNEDVLRENISRLADAYNQPEVVRRVPFDLYRRQVLHQYLHYTRQLIVNGQRKEAIKIYWESLGYVKWSEWRDPVVTFVKLLIG